MIPDSLRPAYKMLPGLPGIYKYFDKGNTIIYVGKSKKFKKNESDLILINNNTKTERQRYW